MISSPELPQTLEIPYRWAGVEGLVRVVVRTNDEPEALACPEWARGFPACEATVESEQARGYDHVYNWIQMVETSYTSSGFHVDHHPTFASPNPYIWAGPQAKFEDAPHTDALDCDFLAHTFLCGTGGELHEFRKEDRAILGFSWGYTKRGERLEWFGPDLLSAEDWDGHREYLTRKYRRRWWRFWRRPWNFAPGFLQHPLNP